MRLLYHPATTALGATTLLLLLMIAPLVSPSHGEIYHLSGPASSIFVPVLILFLAVWLVLSILLWLTRRPGPLQTILWTGLFVLIPYVTVRDGLTLTGHALPHRHYILALSASTVAVLVVVLRRHIDFPSHFKAAKDFSTIVLGFVGLSGILFLCQLLWFGWKARRLNAPIELHQRQLTTALAPTAPRIIWVLLDELSYQQVYERRFKGLELPAFDRFANESTVFTHAVPTGIVTEVAVPSLITGVPVDRIRASADGQQLFLHESSQGRWGLFDAHSSVFADALERGYSTGVAGWYNPYCRILPQVLDRCFWTNHLTLPGGIFPQQTIRWNTTQFVRRLLGYLAGVYAKSSLDQDIQFHQLDYRELFAETDAMLNDPSANFIFLHLPVPHPPGIYNRRDHDFATTVGSSYIDNLVLADQYLAHVRSVLEHRGDWESSAVIVMGDHSWRATALWFRSPYWTAEDTAASAGGFDDRPAYLVKLPGQQKPARIDGSFAAIRTRALFDQLLDGRMKTPEDLAAWASEQH